MHSLGSLSSTFSGQVQAFQGRNVQTTPQRGQLQVSGGSRAYYIALGVPG
jgi:hypothetical protein